MGASKTDFDFGPVRRSTRAMIDPSKIYTLGHSSLSLEEFLDLLRSFDVTQLADVRRFPTSRRHPHFRADSLVNATRTRQIAYRHFEGLGGHRPARPNSPHQGWEEEGFRGYADYMDTQAFRDAVTALESWLVSGRTTALMCAELSPWNCHRQLLSDVLVKRGHEVYHLLGAEESFPHRFTTFARLDGGRIIYDGGMLPFG